MMPPYCPGEAPPGERALFDALTNSPETDRWIVLHSLAIASHVRQVKGEADFVVIVPDHGVLVIEVKSHKSVQRLPDGRWRLGTQAPTSRGPFQQANEAMHSIKHYLTSRAMNLRSVPVIDAVWFTHVRARTMLPQSPEWHSWQLLDSQDLRSGAVSAILRTLAAGAGHLGSRIIGFTYGGVGPRRGNRQPDCGRPAPEVRSGHRARRCPAGTRGAACGLRRRAVRRARQHAAEPGGPVHRSRRLWQDLAGKQIRADLPHELFHPITDEELLAGYRDMFGIDTPPKQAPRRMGPGDPTMVKAKAPSRSPAPTSGATRSSSCSARRRPTIC
jgi:hypothetical protein